MFSLKMRVFALLCLVGSITLCASEGDYEVPEDMAEEGVKDESETGTTKAAGVNEVIPKPEVPTFPTLPNLPSLAASISNGLSTGNCDCGVFLSGSFPKGANKQPSENPALEHECPDDVVCNSIGFKQCTNKCLDVLVKHLPNSPTIICGAIDREVYKERAYLWVKHCNSTSWTNTNLSAGREYCCKENVPYKCPVV